MAIDNAGNREAAPPLADGATHRDAVDHPPENYFSSIGTTLVVCEPTCTMVAFDASGTAADDRSVVSVKWRLWGENDDGSRKRLFNSKAATPSDGAFDEATEPYALSDLRRPGYVAYWVDVQLTAGGQVTTVSTRVPIPCGGGFTLVPC